MIVVLGCLGLFAVFAPIPFAPASTTANCEHHLPPDAIFGCDVTMWGYGSMSYDLSGYGGFMGPAGTYILLF